MSFPDLRTFLDRLRRDDDLVTVEAAVDPHLEAAEIHRRVIAAGGPALLFTHVTGSDFRLTTNLFGTARRAELAFGDRPLRLIRRLVELAETLLPPTPAALWGARDVAVEAIKVGMRSVSTGPVLDRLTAEVRLDRLPALTCWPEDGGPFITLPLVYTTHPDRPGHNLGMYRMHVQDARTTGMHWQIGKGGGYHYQVAEARGQALPATVFLGGPPALILAAIAPLPASRYGLAPAWKYGSSRVPWSSSKAGSAAPMQPRTWPAPVSPSSQGERTPVSQRTKPAGTARAAARTASRSAGTMRRDCWVVNTVATMTVAGSMRCAAR